MWISAQPDTGLSYVLFCTVPETTRPDTKGRVAEVKRQPVICSNMVSEAVVATGFRRKGGSSMATQILLVEDSPGDVRLTKEAFHEVDPSIQVHVANDGIEAMEFLRREGAHLNAPRPDFILLDLNMPKMDGREVLSRLKADPSLKTLPTFILSTSKEGRDVVKSYELQANCYLCKPVGLEAFEKLVRSVNDFWLATVELPHSQLGN